MVCVYQPRSPHSSAYFEVVRRHVNTAFDVLEGGGLRLPRHVRERLHGFLGCGDLSRGFVRVRCPDCAFERLVPFSCKGRAVCPSCGAKRSAAQTAHLVGRVLPDEPIRQWVLSLPFDLRALVSVTPKLHGPINRIFIDEIMRHYGHDGRARWSGAVSVIQRFGAALNLHVHFHVLGFDGAYHLCGDALEFRPAARPTVAEVEVVCARVAERVAQLLIEGGYIDGDGFASVDRTDVIHERPAKTGWLLADGEAVEAPPVQRSARSSPAAEHRGFSVHAGVEIGATDADGRERLCRYVTPIHEPPLRGASTHHCGVKLDCVDLAVLEVARPSPPSKSSGRRTAASPSASATRSRRARPTSSSHPFSSCAVSSPRSRRSA